MVPSASHPISRRAAEPPAGPRLFLDSAVADDWQRWLPLGFFHGVTTNPLLLQRAGQACTLANLEKIAAGVARLGAQEIQMQVWGDDVGTMFHNGSRLALFSGMGIEVVVKVPATADGFRVARRLADAGARLTMTAVFTPGQVLLAAGLGAVYAAPYLGRLNDARKPGRDIVLAMDDIVKYTSSGMRLLVASLRKAEQVVDLAQHGLDTFTIGPVLAAELLEAELTTRAAVQFQAAARQSGAET